MNVEPWVFLEDVAKHLDVAKDSVPPWIDHRGLPAHKIGRVTFRLSGLNARLRFFGLESPQPSIGHTSHHSPSACGSVLGKSSGKRSLPKV
jgi:hypothetical protein